MTNNKIKMAKKNGAEPTPIELLYTAAQNRDLVGIIGAIIDMSNEDFETIDEHFTETLDTVFNSVEFKNHLVSEFNSMPIKDFEKTKEGYENIDKLLDELEMSDKKKQFVRHLFDGSFKALEEYEKDPSEHIEIIYKKLLEDAIVPTYAHLGDAGADLYASEETIARVGEVTFVHTGIAIKIPKGYEGQIRPRSGMSAKTKIRVANAPGTIDSNYRGEICVLVDNYGSSPFVIRKGDRIAQIVFNKVPTADFIEGEVEAEDDNTRGEKGFGSSGVATEASETNE